MNVSTNITLSLIVVIVCLLGYIMPISYFATFMGGTAFATVVWSLIGILAD